MSTVSFIGYLEEDGSVKYVYCHWDGHPSHNGRILLDYWTDWRQVGGMIGEGHLSSLGVDILSCNFYDDHREGEESYSVCEDLEEARKICREYFYVFTKQGWIFSEYKSEFRPLTKQEVDA